MRGDLRLSGVYVCAPDILVLLSDNFDYQSVASDLVPGILSEQELGSTLHIHELGRVRGVAAFCLCCLVLLDPHLLGRAACPFMHLNCVLVLSGCAGLHRAGPDHSGVCRRQHRRAGPLGLSMGTRQQRRRTGFLQVQPWSLCVSSDFAAACFSIAVGCHAAMA